MAQHSADIFAGQMKKLGYQTIYWYGGNASNGNFNHFGRAQGFDRVESATDFVVFKRHGPGLGSMTMSFTGSGETDKRNPRTDVPFYLYNIQSWAL